MTNETEITMEEQVSKNKSKKEFKQTKELIKIALNNGWTQTEIAEKCRTQQPTVSAWSKGKKKATESQVKPLLEQFGYLLRRNTFKVYQYQTETEELSFIKVEGKIVFHYDFYSQKSIQKNGKSIEKYVEIAKLTIHYQGNNQFAIVHQAPLLNTQDKFVTPSHPNYTNSLLVVKRTHIVGSVTELIEKVMEPNYNLTYALEIKFLLIEALLNNGFEVDNVKVYPASW